MSACAQAGASLLNFHGGTLSVLEASLDKSMPTAPEGASYDRRFDAISGRYTPIAGDAREGCYAPPLYYGLLLARHFEDARFIDTSLTSTDLPLTGYAAERAGRRMVAVFNKDLQHDAGLQIDAADTRARQAIVWRLSAPTIDDVHHAQFAGAPVGHAGGWSRRSCRCPRAAACRICRAAAQRCRRSPLESKHPAGAGCLHRVQAGLGQTSFLYLTRCGPASSPRRRFLSASYSL